MQSVRPITGEPQPWRPALADLPMSTLTVPPPPVDPAATKAMFVRASTGGVGRKVLLQRTTIARLAAAASPTAPPGPQRSLSEDRTSSSLRSADDPDEADVGTGPLPAVESSQVKAAGKASESDKGSTKRAGRLAVSRITLRCDTTTRLRSAPPAPPPPLPVPTESNVQVPVPCPRKRVRCPGALSGVKARGTLLADCFPLRPHTGDCPFENPAPVQRTDCAGRRCYADGVKPCEVSVRPTKCRFAKANAEGTAVEREGAETSDDVCATVQEQEHQERRCQLVATKEDSAIGHEKGREGNEKEAEPDSPCIRLVDVRPSTLSADAAPFYGHAAAVASVAARPPIAVKTQRGRRGHKLAPVSPSTAAEERPDRYLGFFNGSSMSVENPIAVLAGMQRRFHSWASPPPALRIEMHRGLIELYRKMVENAANAEAAFTAASEGDKEDNDVMEACTAERTKCREAVAAARAFLEEIKLDPDTVLDNPPPSAPTSPGTDGQPCPRGPNGETECDQWNSSVPVPPTPPEAADRGVKKVPAFIVDYRGIPATKLRTKQSIAAELTKVRAVSPSVAVSKSAGNDQSAPTKTVSVESTDEQPPVEASPVFDALLAMAEARLDFDGKVGEIEEQNKRIIFYPSHMQNRGVTLKHDEFLEKSGATHFTTPPAAAVAGKSVQVLQATGQTRSERYAALKTKTTKGEMYTPPPPPTTAAASEEPPVGVGVVAGTGTVTPPPTVPVSAPPPPAGPGIQVPGAVQVRVGVALPPKVPIASKAPPCKPAMLQDLAGASCVITGLAKELPGGAVTFACQQQVSPSKTDAAPTVVASSTPQAAPAVPAAPIRICVGAPVVKAPAATPAPPIAGQPAKGISIRIGGPCVAKPKAPVTVSIGKKAPAPAAKVAHVCPRVARGEILPGNHVCAMAPESATAAAANAKAHHVSIPPPPATVTVSASTYQASKSMSPTAPAAGENTKPRPVCPRVAMGVAMPHNTVCGMTANVHDENAKDHQGEPMLQACFARCGQRQPGTCVTPSDIAAVCRAAQQQGAVLECTEVRGNAVRDSESNFKHTDCPLSTKAADARQWECRISPGSATSAGTPSEKRSSQSTASNGSPGIAAVCTASFVFDPSTEAIDAGAATASPPPPLICPELRGAFCPKDGCGPPPPSSVVAKTITLRNDDDDEAEHLNKVSAIVVPDQSVAKMVASASGSPTTDHAPMPTASPILPEGPAGKEAAEVKKTGAELWSKSAQPLQFNVRSPPSKIDERALGDLSVTSQTPQLQQTTPTQQSRPAPSDETDLEKEAREDRFAAAAAAAAAPTAPRSFQVPAQDFVRPNQTRAADDDDDELEGMPDYDHSTVVADDGTDRTSKPKSTMSQGNRQVGDQIDGSTTPGPAENGNTSKSGNKDPRKVYRLSIVRGILQSSARPFPLLRPSVPSAVVPAIVLEEHVSPHAADLRCCDLTTLGRACSGARLSSPPDVVASDPLVLELLSKYCPDPAALPDTAAATKIGPREMATLAQAVGTMRNAAPPGSGHADGNDPDDANAEDAGSEPEASSPVVPFTREDTMAASRFFHGSLKAMMIDPCGLPVEHCLRDVIAENCPSLEELTVVGDIAEDVLLPGQRPGVVADAVNVPEVGDARTNGRSADTASPLQATADGQRLDERDDSEETGPHVIAARNSIQPFRAVGTPDVTVTPSDAAVPSDLVQCDVLNGEMVGAQMTHHLRKKEQFKVAEAKAAAKATRRSSRAAGAALKDDDGDAVDATTTASAAPASLEKQNSTSAVSSMGLTQRPKPPVSSLSAVLDPTVARDSMDVGLVGDGVMLCAPAPSSKQGGKQEGRTCGTKLKPGPTSSAVARDAALRAAQCAAVRSTTHVGSVDTDVLVNSATPPSALSVLLGQADATDEKSDGRDKSGRKDESGGKKDQPSGARVPIPLQDTDKIAVFDDMIDTLIVDAREHNRRQREAPRRGAASPQPTESVRRKKGDDEADESTAAGSGSASPRANPRATKQALRRHGQADMRHPGGVDSTYDVAISLPGLIPFGTTRLVTDQESSTPASSNSPVPVQVTAAQAAPVQGTPAPPQHGMQDTDDADAAATLQLRVVQQEMRFASTVALEKYTRSRIGELGGVLESALPSRTHQSLFPADMVPTRHNNSQSQPQSQAQHDATLPGLADEGHQQPPPTVAEGVADAENESALPEPEPYRGVLWELAKSPPPLPNLTSLTAHVVCSDATFAHFAQSEAGRRLRVLHPPPIAPFSVQAIGQHMHNLRELTLGKNPCHDGVAFELHRLVHLEVLTCRAAAMENMVIASLGTLYEHRRRAERRKIRAERRAELATGSGFSRELSGHGGVKGLMAAVKAEELALLPDVHDPVDDDDDETCSLDSSRSDCPMASKASFARSVEFLIGRLHRCAGNTLFTQLHSLTLFDLQPSFELLLQGRRKMRFLTLHGGMECGEAVMAAGCAHIATVCRSLERLSVSGAVGPEAVMAFGCSSDLATAHRHHHHHHHAESVGAILNDDAKTPPPLGDMTDAWRALSSDSIGSDRSQLATTLTSLEVASELSSNSVLPKHLKDLRALRVLGVPRTRWGAAELEAVHQQHPNLTELSIGAVAPARRKGSAPMTGGASFLTASPSLYVPAVRALAYGTAEKIPTDVASLSDSRAPLRYRSSLQKLKVSVPKASLMVAATRKARVPFWAGVRAKGNTVELVTGAEVVVVPPAEDLMDSMGDDSDMAE